MKWVLLAAASVLGAIAVTPNDIYTGNLTAPNDCCTGQGGYCEDGTPSTPCCGYGGCNMFCCACDGGCRMPYIPPAPPPDCTCYHGTRAYQCPDSGEHCSSCDEYYHLSYVETCVANRCRCESGVPQQYCLNDGEAACQECDIGYRLVGAYCYQNSCGCPNGEPVFYTECTSDGTVHCESCDFGFSLNGTECTPWWPWVFVLAVPILCIYCNKKKTNSASTSPGPASTSREPDQEPHHDDGPNLADAIVGGVAYYQQHQNNRNANLTTEDHIRMAQNAYSTSSNFHATAAAVEQGDYVGASRNARQFKHSVERVTEYHAPERDGPAREPT